VAGVSALAEPSRRRRRGTVAGVSGLLVAVLGSVAGVLGSLHLRGVVDVGLVVLIAVAGVVVGLLAQTFTERGARADEARQARGSMALKPGPIGRFGLAQTGVVGSGPQIRDWESYSGSIADSEIGAAVSEPGTVLVVSESAALARSASFAALNRNRSDAILLMPQTAEVLAELLDAPTSRLVRRDRTYVLWLDDLPRFLSGVRLRRYDKFLQSGVVTVVATAREGAWTRARELEDDDGVVARGLAARSRVVTIAAQSTEDAQNAVSLAPQMPDPTPPRFGRADREDGESKVLSGPTLVGVALMLAAAAFVGVEWKLAGLEEHAHETIAQSFAEIRGQHNGCGGVGVSPHAPVDGMADVVAVAHDSDICATADRVEIYAAGAQTLATKPTVQLALKPRPARTFRCIGPDPRDRCHTNWKNGLQVTLGAFSSPRTDLWMPLVIYRTHVGRYTVAALDQPHRPTGRMTTLWPSPAAANQFGVAKLEAHAVSVVAALAGHANESATLLLASRRLGAGDTLDVHAFALSLSGGNSARATCERGGRPDGTSPVQARLARGTPPAPAADAIRRAWLTYVRSGASLRCV
jgi:hypothetical protein